VKNEEVDSFFWSGRNIYSTTCSSGSASILPYYHHLFWKHSLNTLERCSILLTRQLLTIETRIPSSRIAS